MNYFTISQLQRFSGISVHCIRAWEKRYNAFKPDRSEGNTRYYNGNQLRRLLNIASLMNSEYKISELCSMSDSNLNDLATKILELKIPNDKNEFLISQMVFAAVAFDEPLFKKIYDYTILQNGVESSYLNVIYPAMERLGAMWLADKISPAQEHFIIQLIRQKLSTAIDLLPSNTTSKEHWLLFLPEYEFHEIGLLMASYMVRNAGHRCTYLGANVPFETMTKAVHILKPSSLLFFLVHKDDEQVDATYVQKLLSCFPDQKIFGAAQAHRLSMFNGMKNFTALESPNQLKETLDLCNM